MENNSAKMMFMLIVILGTLITISSNSWLSAWMGLEINLLSFIPLMKDNKNNLMSTEAFLKYFLVQALASLTLLFMVIMLLMFNYLNYNCNKLLMLMILFSLLMKSGSAPFHFWFPNVMEGLTWMNSLLLLTWQKIAPLMLISYLINNNFLLISMILSSIIGAIGGLNQTSLRKLMAYSSINNLGWMLAAMYCKENLWMIYFLFYAFLTTILIMFFNMFKIFHINQLYLLFMNSKLLKFSIFLNLLSLGGLPPFLGFMPKWILIQNLIFDNQLFLMIIMTMMALITLFFYLRLCYTIFMLNFYQNNWMFQFNMNNFMMNLFLIMTFISIFGLLIISMIYFML